MDLKIAFCVILLVRDVQLDKSLVSESIAKMRCDTCQHNPETCCVGIFMHPTYIITTAFCAKSCGKITWKTKEVFVRKMYILSKNLHKYHRQNTVIMNNNIALLKVRQTKQRRVLKLSSVDTSLVTGSVAFVPIQRKKYLIRRKVYIEQCPNEVFKQSFVCVESTNYRVPQRCLRTQGLPLLLDNRIIGITGTIDENICDTQAPKVFLATRAAIKIIYNIIVKSNRTKHKTYFSIKRRTDAGSRIVTAITATHTVLTASDNTMPTQSIYLEPNVTKRGLSLLMPKLTSTTPMSSSVLGQDPLYLDTFPSSPRCSYVPTSQSTTCLPIRARHWETAITAKMKTPSVIIITTPKRDFLRNIAINALMAKHNKITYEMNTSSPFPLKINALRLQGNVTKAAEVLELNINDNETNFKLDSMVRYNLKLSPDIKMFFTATKPTNKFPLNNMEQLATKPSINGHQGLTNCTETTFTSSLMSTINTISLPIIAWQNNPNSKPALPLLANTNNDPVNKSTIFIEKENGNLNRVHKALARFKAAMKTNKKIRHFIVQKTVTAVGPPSEFMDLT